MAKQSVETQDNKKKKSTAKRVVRVIVNIIIWLFIAFSVAVTILSFSAQSSADGIPTIGGKVISPVLSDSMAPTFKKGDIILSTKLTDDEKADLKVGDIITFKADLDGDGNAEINTHRIVEVIVEDNSEFVQYKTAGDNNNDVVDNYNVAPADVISIWVEGENTRLPGLGNVIDFLLKPTGFLVCIVLPLIIFFIFEIVMFVRKLIEVKNSDKKQITAADEELIKQKAIEEYLRSQKEAGGDAEAAAEAAPEEVKEAVEEAAEAVEEAAEAVEEAEPAEEEAVEAPVEEAAEEVEEAVEAPVEEAVEEVEEAVEAPAEEAADASDDAAE